MASIGTLKRSGSNGKTALLWNPSMKEMENRTEVERMAGETSSALRQELKSLTVSKRLIRSISFKSKKNEEDERNERRFSFRCLGLFGKGGGCKVGAEMCEDFGDGSGRRKSSVGEECMAYRAISGIEEAGVDCFWRRNSRKLKEIEPAAPNNGVRFSLPDVGEEHMAYRAIPGIEEARVDCFWRRNSRKLKEIEPAAPSNGVRFSLPDDVLELCLVRVSLTTLMNARLVCKKWRSLTSTPHFMQKRSEGSYQSPWLFLFGLVRDGYCSGQIHALDVAIGRWHRMDADILKGRFHFSVASVGSDVYVVGGCSSLANFGRFDKSSVKTHKGVLVFSPLNGSWRKVASMKVVRSGSVLGVFEVGSGYSIFHTQHDRQDRRFSRLRVSGVLDVYEDPHRFSLRRQLRDASNESEAGSSQSRRKPCKFVKQEEDQSVGKASKRLLLIVVGGRGSWDEPLDSAEIYDPVSNRWMDIARLPEGFGVVCSGTVCNGMFYVCSEIGKLAGYNLERGVWVAIQTARSPPRLREYYPKLVSCNYRLFMLCVSWCERDGQTSWREEAVRKLWELDLRSMAWTEVSRHPDAPMDSNAVFVADGGRIFGVEMFKIFCQVLDFVTVCNVSDSNLKWSHISRKHLAHGVDASSCTTKSMAVMHL